MTRRGLGSLRRRPDLPPVDAHAIARPCLDPAGPHRREALVRRSPRAGMAAAARCCIGNGLGCRRPREVNRIGRAWRHPPPRKESRSPLNTLPWVRPAQPAKQGRLAPCPSLRGRGTAGGRHSLSRLCMAEPALGICPAWRSHEGRRRRRRTAEASLVFAKSTSRAQSPHLQASRRRVGRADDPVRWRSSRAVSARLMIATSPTR